MVATKASVEPLSRRNANKLRTTNVLRDAAFELFLANGYEETTTDQIAAKAGLSTRTFFRYFDAKDEVLFRGQRFWSESVADLVKKQPAELNPVDAMRATLIELATGFSREGLVRYERIIKSSTALLGRSVMQQAENAARVADGLAARMGLSSPNDECKIMAAVGLMLYQQAVGELRDGTRKGPIAALIREKFNVLEAIYAKVVTQRPPVRACAPAQLTP